jgi:hypothetical protein
MTRIHNVHRHSLRTKALISLREWLLIVLVALLASVAIYTARDTNTAFGLLTQPVYADFVPVEITFREDVLFSESFFELDLQDRDLSAEQTKAVLFDTTNPPSITNLHVFNTRVGGEVMLYWSFPDGVTAASVYRTLQETGKEARIAESVTDSFVVDTEVTNRKAYTYRVV